MKLRKWKALLNKDARLVFKNKNIVLLLALPIFFAIIYSNLFPDMHGEADRFALLSLITGLGMMVIGGSVMAMAISEEKEKKTLRSLMLSDVSASEFIVSKMIIILILFVIVMVVCFMVVGSPIAYLPQYLLMIVLTTISLLFISSIVGILSPSQQAAGVLSTPIMLVMGIPMFAMMGNNGFLTLIAKLMPSGPIMLILNAKAGAVENYATALGYGSMLIWIVISLALFTFFYKRNSMDN